MSRWSLHIADSSAKLASACRHSLPRLTLWLLVVCGNAAQSQELHLGSRIEPKAELLSLTSAGWKFAELKRPVPTSQIVRWGAWPGILKQPAVWLSDGSWLVGEIQFSDAGTLKVDSHWLDAPPMDLGSVRGIVFNPPASLSKWLELQQQMLAAEGGQDLVWLLNKQRVAGVIRWPNKASLMEEFTLDTGAQATAIALESVAAIVLSPTLAGPLPRSPKQTIGLSDGSLLHVAEVSVPTERAVTLQLMADLELKSVDPPAGFASAVRYVAGAVPEVTFLSDLAPASYRHASETKLTWDLGVDTDLTGKPLVLNQGVIFKGLSLHSASQVAYRWDGTAARLLAQVALAPANPQARPALGSVTCRVLVARGGKLETVQEFKLARPAAQPADPKQKPVSSEHTVDVDLTGAQLLVLIVEQGDFGQYGDHVFWLDARIATVAAQ